MLTRRLAAVVLVSFAAGCGGESEEERAARSRCLSQAYNAAEAAAVARMYDAGELGPKARVREQLDLPGKRFFDARGRMIPYERLDRMEQTQLVFWFTLGPIGEATEEAREDAVDRAEPDC